ncbi:MAG TPA: hypothetical protein ENN57_02645 [Chloroflexi bacterium]|nr:hypothetical protein [Chloroflexota bacterium]
MIARNHIIGIVAGAVLIVATITGALLIGREAPHSSPEAVVHRLLEVYFTAGEGDASQLLDLVDPQALEEIKQYWVVEMDEVREMIQADLDEIQQEIEMGASISFEVGNTVLQNGDALTMVTITFSHPEHGGEEFTDSIFIPTIKRDGRWYLEDLIWW